MSLPSAIVVAGSAIVASLPTQSRSVPPLSAMGAYARKVTRSKDEMVIGGTLFEIIDGKLLPPEFVMAAIDTRTKEVFYGDLGRRSRKRKKRKRRA